MSPSSRESLWLHLALGVAGMAVLYLAHGAQAGRSILLLALGYNLLVPALGFVRRHAEWLSLWSFLLPVSAAQVLPDLALVKIGNVLTFPDTSVYRIGGEVPVYFMGLWMMLLFPILLAGNARRSRYVYTGMLAFVFFALAEWVARPLGLWHAHGVRTGYGVALYVLIPEMLLCLAALAMYRLTDGRGILARLAGALCVPVFYAGALFISLTLTG